MSAVTRRPARWAACGSVDTLSLQPRVESHGPARIPWYTCAACGSEVGWPLPDALALALDAVAKTTQNTEPPAG